MTSTESAAIMEPLLAKLAEHFDTAQIVASEILPDGATRAHRHGFGNYYARTRMCDELSRDDVAQNAASYMPKPPPDEGEDWKEPV